MSVIEARNLRKTYRKTVAVDGGIRASPPSKPDRHPIDAPEGPGSSVLLAGAEGKQGGGPFRHPAEVNGRKRRRQGTPAIGQTCSPAAATH